MIYRSRIFQNQLARASSIRNRKAGFRTRGEVTLLAGRERGQFQIFGATEEIDAEHGELRDRNQHGWKPYRTRLLDGGRRGEIASPESRPVISTAGARL